MINQVPSPFQNYNLLKEKILQQVGPRSAAAGSSSSAAPRKSRLFPERPLLTLDFLPPTTTSDERIGPLGAIPVPSQESAVIDDLVSDSLEQYRDVL